MPPAPPENHQEKAEGTTRSHKKGKEGEQFLPFLLTNRPEGFE